MKHILMILLFVLPMVAFADTHVLMQGSNTKIPIQGVGSLWVENDKSIQVTDLGSALQVFAKKPGGTRLVQGAFETRIEVLDKNSFDAWARMKLSLLQMRGIQLDVKDGVIILNGKLLRLEDWTTLAHDCGSCQMQLQVQLSADLKERARSFLQNKIKNSSMPSIQIKWDKIEPQISLPSSLSQYQSQFQKLLGPFGVKILLDETLLEVAPMVRVQILVAEVKRKQFLRYGVKLPTSYQAQVVPQNGTTDLVPFDVAINALEENGLGKVLAQPTLVARSGKEAQFFAGGEIPIKVSSFRTHEVLWKKYGVVLSIKPVADFSGKMSIAIETEVSSIDTSQVIDGVPALFTNRIQSHFDLSRSQTIALSGLIKSEAGQSREGLPLLSRLPVLGALFSSRDFRENRTELVVFVTPSIAKEDDALPAMPNEIPGS